MNTPIISWDRIKLAKLKDAYAESLRERKAVFTVDVGQKVEFVPAYAKHLIDYLEHQFFCHPDRPAEPNNEGREGQ